MGQRYQVTNISLTIKNIKTSLITMVKQFRFLRHIKCFFTVPFFYRRPTEASGKKAHPRQRERGRLAKLRSIVSHCGAASPPPSLELSGARPSHQRQIDPGNAIDLEEYTSLFAIKSCKRTNGEQRTCLLH
ncbi:hypothetical protein CEXT_216461 [Caerostris extrusa]|uniref:Uncharacterized protein n=1 Tax=Caerostris extrusa TaxID=172846 RepID=A0AAV4M526_CAEEX|nr:hypothetical protein CEXT_216461 [Caerostris extrusa]